MAMAPSSPAPKIACPHCGGTMKSPALPPGSRVACPKCNQPFTLDQPTGPTAGPTSSPRSTQSPRPPARPPLPPPPPPGPNPVPPTSAPADSLPPIPLDPEPSAPPQATSQKNSLVDPMVAATLAHRPVAVEAPESEMVPVVCQVCGTRMHALRTDIGQTIRCPDCHTENSIKAPAIVARPKGPSLDVAAEY
jgi:DNA-directed RNA polymerase subunit M/transcription elongation factor TFIIS